MPPPPVLPESVEDAIALDNAQWEHDVRTYLQGTPSVARNLAKLAHRSRAKASAPVHHDAVGEALWTSRQEKDLIREPMDLGCQTEDPSAALRAGLPSGWRFSAHCAEADGDVVQREHAIDLGAVSSRLKELDFPSVQRIKNRTMAAPHGSAPLADDHVADDEAVLLRDGDHFHLGPPICRRPSPAMRPSVTPPIAAARCDDDDDDASFRPPESAKDPHRRPWRGDIISMEPVWPQPPAGDFASGSDVILQVYDLTNWTHASNIPIYHLGVQVYRLEYFFCYLGIQTCMPCRNKGHIFRESVNIGRTNLTLQKVRAIVQRLRREWRMESYRILGRNCQTFATTFCDELGLRDCVPAEYCRFSELESLRSQVSSLVDGAAALLPRMPQRPSMLLACSMPTVGNMDICTTRRQAQAHYPVSSYGSPRFPEESLKASAVPQVSRHARAESHGGA